MLKRVVAVVKFLCERGLPFHGENEVFGSPQNANFLRLLELLAQFKDFLADHICQFGNSGGGVPSYLSSTTGWAKSHFGFLICCQFAKYSYY